MAKKPPARAGDIRDAALIPRSGIPLRRAWQPTSRVIAWKIPWTEEPGGLSPQGHKESDRTEATACMHRRQPIQ